MIRSTLMPKSKHKTYHSKLQYILVVFPKNVTIPVYYLTQYSYQLRKKNVLDTFYKFDCLYQHSYSHFPTYKTSIQYHKMLLKFFLDTFPWNDAFMMHSRIKFALCLIEVRSTKVLNGLANIFCEIHIIRGDKVNT